MADGAKVLASDVSLTDGTSRQVQDSVAVVLDFGKQLGDTGLGPILPDDGQNVPEHVRLCDGPVDIRDDHFVIVTPKVDVTLAPGRALVRSCDAENRLVWTFAQMQQTLSKEKKLFLF